jgi:tetratricopeptide (TPR) repeat protein
MRKLFQAALVALVLVPSVGAAQDFDKGLAAYNVNACATALEEWRPLAEQGDAKSQTYFGLMYENGKCVPRNYEEAAKWYRLAAEQGDADAQINLGKLYHRGIGVPQDFAEAERWFRLAAEQASAEALFAVGLVYERYAEAIKWFRLSAEQGFSKAQFRLGVGYERGNGGLQDYVSAHMWYNIASANGDEMSSERRDDLTARMTPADISEAQRRARVCMASDYQDCD